MIFSSINHILVPSQGEKASGSSLFMPSVITKNSSALNDSGKITNKGAIKKIKTQPQIKR